MSTKTRRPTQSAASRGRSGPKRAAIDLGAPDYPRNLRAVSIRHTVVVLIAAALTAVFWFTRMDWDPEMRAWRAVGDASIMLLFGSLVLGPLGRLWRPAARTLPWRRELGIWFALLAAVHTVLVLINWVQWDWGRLMGYEFIPQLGRDARMEPGFGLANLMGLFAMLWALVLAATSSDRGVRLLGTSAWKWLHNGSYVIFYLVVIHAAYFLFIHYTMSFHREAAPVNWFRWPLVWLGLGVVVLQWAAFVKTVRRRRR